MRMRHVVMCALSDCAVFFFFSTSDKQRDFRKRKLLNVKRMFRFPVHILSETLLILRIIERGLLIM